MTDGAGWRDDSGARHRPRPWSVPKGDSQPASLPPLARVAMLAVPGGMLIGAVLGSLFPAAVLLGDLVFTGASAAAPVSFDYPLVASQVGLLIGVFLGFVIGLVVAGVVAACWALRLPRWAAAGVGSVVVVAVVAAAGIGLVGADPQTLSIVLLASTHGIGGIVLLTWIGGLRPGSASSRRR
ncbi:hypothetical protein [Herbiconiux daphne]|uniref:DUF998 domain-containing protein n=1 Tax=Herbiconiux daphne TaxID=2970914 RepID=A0ABT2H192_9MICO|nr:hypothetical protein [Herbiconiux daphne]MCS5733697.1 hypothetical protein [Herbiconiux daphne]